MTPEEIAAVKKLTAELNEVTAICGRMKDTMDELSRVDPQTYAALIETVNGTGEVR